MKKAFTLFLCLALAGLLFLSPALIMQGIHKNTYTLWEQKRQNSYTGNLTLWHVVSFKTGGETGVSYLKSRIRAFEKNNPYVFIQLKALTAEEAEAAIAAGEFPDLISFPLGFDISASQLSELPDQHCLLQPYRNIGRYQNALYAYPYMADFYTLCCNQDVLFYDDISLPFDSELSADALSELTESFAHSTSAELSLGSTAAFYAPLSYQFVRDGSLSSEHLQFWQRDLYRTSSDFWEKQSSLLLCPAAEAKKADAQNLTNAITLKTYAFSDYTDLCQFIAVRANLETAKEQMCQAFAASLLSDTAQKSLTSLYMLPTTSQEEIYEDTPLYLQEYAHMSHSACIPNHFALAATGTQDNHLLFSDITQCREILQLGK